SRSSSPPGSAAAPPAGGGARGADACGGSAAVGLSVRRPLQLRPVRFSAAGSTVPAAAVVFYDFNYGDGSDDATAAPTAVHAYHDPGQYLAKVSIVTTCNTIVSSAEYAVTVLDGQPPVASIGFPRADQTAHFGRAGLQLSGTATDPSGVRRVELAIQLLKVTRAVSSSKAGAVGPGCYWYDGKLTLRLRACAEPLFFAARVGGGRWSFRMNPRSQIPPGVYAVRVRATDRLGNLTTVFSPKLVNILAFRLVA
ncbi:MAG: PKD domain-containing protein, partial [Solirubrobacteraceae bacterium]